MRQAQPLGGTCHARFVQQDQQHTKQVPAERVLSGWHWWTGGSECCRCRLKFAKLHINRKPDPQGCAAIAAHPAADGQA
jgi:hypothetical protein